MNGVIKVEFQHSEGKYTLVGLDSPIPDNWKKKVTIDGKEYDTEIVYDLPNHIAIIGNGNFVGKEIVF